VAAASIGRLPAAYRGGNMSQRRIKAKKQHADPLDWVRTDDRSMFECFYILLMTRGLYSVFDSLIEACSYEAEVDRAQKAQFHPSWIQNAEFCEDAIAVLRDAAQALHSRWDSDIEEEVPNTARRKKPIVGAFYPLIGVNGEPGLYIPKK
jgi:hypothetical protein